MRIAHPVLSSIAVLLFIASSLAAADRSEILGRWRGTSICTKVEGNEHCRDEQVQYDFMPHATDASVVTLDAQKLVNGTYETMGKMDFHFDAATKRWASKFHAPRANRDGIWSFEIHGDTMTGTCVMLPDMLARNVQAKRVTR